MEKRSLVIIVDDCGGVEYRLLLTDDQIRLVNWLIDRGYINRDCHNFEVLNEKEPPITI